MGQGIVRKLDQLGRVVIPQEYRNVLEWQTDTTLSITCERNAVILKHHEETCTFCGHTSDLRIFKGKQICSACAEELRD